MPGYCGIQRDTAGYSGIQRDTTGYGGYSGIQRDTAGYSGIQRDTAGYSGTQRDNIKIYSRARVTFHNKINTGSVVKNSQQYNLNGYKTPTCM
jgi:hypothetical protein